MRTGWLKLLILLVSISCPAMAQVSKLYPVDEGSKDPSFQAFRDKLIEAAKNRDAKYILSILDPNILNSFGGNGGVKEFKEQWKLDNPNSELWGVLGKILSMGGSFSKNEFCAPYVFSKFPELDPFEHSAIIGEQVRVREQPDLTSPVIASLSYDIVAITDPFEPIKKGRTFLDRHQTFEWQIGFRFRTIHSQPHRLSSLFYEKEWEVANENIGCRRLIKSQPLAYARGTDRVYCDAGGLSVKMM
jgi:hypothetical protein